MRWDEMIARLTNLFIIIIIIIMRWDVYTHAGPVLRVR